MNEYVDDIFALRGLDEQELRRVYAGALSDLARRQFDERLGRERSKSHIRRQLKSRAARALTILKERGL